jgi:hypothetical protein
MNRTTSFLREVAVNVKVGALATVIVSALVSGCSTVGGGNLSLGFQRTDSLYQTPTSSGQVVPTLQWKMALNGPKKPLGTENTLNASESGTQSSDDTFLWTVLGVAAGYYLVQSLQEEEEKPQVCTGVVGYYGIVTTTCR